MKSIVAKLMMMGTAALLVGALAMPARADHRGRCGPIGGPRCAVGGGFQNYGCAPGFSHRHHHGYRYGSPGYGRGGFGYGPGYGGYSPGYGSPYTGYRPWGYAPSGVGLYLPRVGLQLGF